MRNRRYRLTLVIALSGIVAIMAVIFYHYLEYDVPVKGLVHNVIAWVMQRETLTPVETEADVSPPEKKGLVPVQLTPQRWQKIGIKTDMVRFGPVYKRVRTVGNVEVNERSLSYVHLRFKGWIKKTFADAAYQYIEKGQPLFTIYSPDLVSTEREYLLARPYRRLFVNRAPSGKVDSGNPLLEAIIERLRRWDVPDHEIRRLKETGKVNDSLEIDSPVSGYIVALNARPGLYVTPQTHLYTIADLSKVWIYAAVFQNEIDGLKAGSPASITIDTYPGRKFKARVDYIWPVVDEATRTVRVRLVLANPDLEVLPGMYVNVELKLPVGRFVTVPADGVFHSGMHTVVFVDRGSGYLEPREVEVGRRVDGRFVVLKGLKEGERIVTSANFLIDSESQLQAAIGSFLPPPPGAGQAAAMNRPQAAIKFETISPLSKGRNLFQVKLLDDRGREISGAQVRLTFFMPAMPAMGMAAMRSEFTLKEKGGGVYTGEGKLQSGGTWQVTIVARKGGKTIATKQLTVNAKGGM